MEERYQNYTKSKTTKLFDQLNILWYLASLPGFWIDEVKLPKTFQAIYDRYTKVMRYGMILFILASAGAYLTQHDLTLEQQNNKMTGCGGVIIVIYHLILSYYKDEIRKILYYLTVYLKEFNNEKVEQKMIYKIKCYAHIFSWASLGNMIARGISGALQVYRGGLFITYIAIWPDVKDPSLLAEIARYIIYLMWYIVLLQTVGSVLMVMTVHLVLSYQYENLTCYFYGLDDIFKDRSRSQLDKEKAYEEGLLKGIQWHSITLWCVGRCQHVFRLIYNVELTFSPLLLTSILPAFLDPDMDTKTKVAYLPIFISILVALGFFMWPAGDVTVEASKLPEGLYGSGWQNCHGHNGIKLRKIIIIAMHQAQQPVVFKAFDTLTLSYESYVTGPPVSQSEGPETSGLLKHGVLKTKVVLIKKPVTDIAGVPLGLLIVKASYSLFSLLAL